MIPTALLHLVSIACLILAAPLVSSVEAMLSLSLATTSASPTTTLVVVSRSLAPVVGLHH